MALYGKVGSLNPTYLLSDPIGAEPIAIPCEPGAAIIEAGTIMYRKSTGLYAPATTTQMDGSYSLVVLAEDVDVTVSATVAEDAAAYRSGRFVRGKVKLAAGNAITAAYELILRQQNIVFDVMTPEYSDYNVTITYKANNSGTEADYVDYISHGEEYTILANSVTGFTPPSTKSFSKWNTEDDGSGDDYSAADTYTANAALTLYAIWA